MGKVKVRIAVAVDPTGDWNAYGYKHIRSDADMMAIACEVLSTGEARYFLEAELDIPEQKTIVATVHNGGIA